MGLLEYFTYLIAEYTAAGKRYAASLRSAQRKLSGYLSGKEIPLAAVTPRFILDYRGYLQGCVAAETVQFYVGILRTVIRRAEREGRLRPDFVWPMEARVSAGGDDGRMEVHALDVPTLRRIAALDTRGDAQLELARDVFMFAFYAQGMELTDVINLTSANLCGNMLSYRRRQVGKLREVMLGPKSLEIVGRYRGREGEHLFPLGLTGAETAYPAIRARVAESLRKVGELLGLPVRLTFSMNIYSWQAVVRSVNLAEAIINA